jgi:putative peptidoglycan lipid II flippase
MRDKSKIISFFSYIKVGGWTLVSRIFGLLRDITTTSLMGASAIHDVFIVALKIPNIFRSIFAEGAFNQAFIPIYSEYQRDRKTRDIKEFIDSIAGILLLVLFIFTALGLFFAPIFIFLFAPGFYYEPTKADLMVDVLRIMFPYLGLVSLVAFAGGIQNTHNRFSVPAATPVIFNLCIILSAFILAPIFSVPIFGLAWGVLLSGFIQVLVQLFPLNQINRLPIPKINFGNKGVKKVFLLMIPAIIAGGITQINSLIDTVFVSFLGTGSPTWLYASERLLKFPLGVFALAIGTVLLPSLSQSNQSGDIALFREQLMKSMRLVIFLALPSLVGLSLCAEHLISVLFQRGEFSYYDVVQASKSLVAFSLGLPFFMIIKILMPAFFSRQDTKTPMYAALFGLICNVMLNYIFAIKLGYGHTGIALGSSLAAILTSLSLFLILLNKEYILIVNIFNKFNFALVTSLLAISLFLIFGPFDINFDLLTFPERLLNLTIEIIVSIFLYLGIMRIIVGNKLRNSF